MSCSSKFLSSLLSLSDFNTSSRQSVSSSRDTPTKMPLTLSAHAISRRLASSANWCVFFPSLSADRNLSHSPRTASLKDNSKSAEEFRFPRRMPHPANPSPVTVAINPAKDIQSPDCIWNDITYSSSPQIAPEIGLRTAWCHQALVGDGQWSWIHQSPVHAGCLFVGI